MDVDSDNEQQSPSKPMQSPATTTEEHTQIIHLLSILYRHHIFAEFRSPVLVQYPALFDSYAVKISDPMDLGTLLVHALQHRLTVSELRDGLQLVVSNALSFNKDYSPYIIAVTKHLDLMAMGLFEEMFSELYQSIYNSASKEKVKQTILSKRLKRYELIEKTSLNENELGILLTVIENFPIDEFFPMQSPAKKKKTDNLPSSLFLESLSMISEAKTKLEERTSLLARRKEEDKEIRDEEENKPEDDADPLKKYSKYDLSLKQILEPILIAFIKMSDSPSTSSLKPLPSKNPIQPENIPLLKVLYYDKIPMISSSFLPFLETLDEMLGLLLVYVEERVYRGVAFSNCWNIPHPTCIWSQIIDDSRHKYQWWPSMILVSNSPVYPMSLEVMEKNIDRLPKNYIKDLTKFKPKVSPTAASSSTSNSSLSVPPSTSTDADEGKDGETGGSANPPSNGKANGTNGGKALSSTLTSVACPEGYLVVEYFGAHDIGWAKVESTQPMSENGELPKFPKLCANDVFREAEEGRKALTKYHQSQGICITTATPIVLSTSKSSELIPPPPQDLSTIPSLEELLKSIQPTPELIKIKEDFEKQMILKQQKKEAEQQRKEAAALAAAAAKANLSEASTRSRRESSSSSRRSSRAAPTPTEIEDDEEDEGNGSSSITPAKGKAKSSNKKKIQEREESNGYDEQNAYYLPDDDGNDENGKEEEQEDEEEDDDDDDNDHQASSLSTRSYPRSVKGKPISNEILDNRGNVLTHVATPSKLRPVDFKITVFEKAIINQRYYVSKCPNPSFIVTSNHLAPLPGFHTKKGINVRRNAIVNTRGLTYWLNKVKPLSFTDIPLPAPSLPAPITPYKQQDDHYNNVPSTGKKKNVSIRAYQHPIAPTTKELHHLPTSAFFSEFHETLLESGCSRYYNGKGIIYSRIIDFNHPIFYREDRDVEKRKDKIIKELNTLQYLTDKLVKGEPLTEDEKEEEEEGEEVNDSLMDVEHEVNGVHEHAIEETIVKGAVKNSGKKTPKKGGKGKGKQEESLESEYGGEESSMFGETTSQPSQASTTTTNKKRNSSAMLNVQSSASKKKK
eukprot:gene3453-3681_t